MFCYNNFHSLYYSKYMMSYLLRFCLNMWHDIIVSRQQHFSLGRVISWFDFLYLLEQFTVLWISGCFFSFETLVLVLSTRHWFRYSFTICSCVAKSTRSDCQTSSWTIDTSIPYRYCSYLILNYHGHCDVISQRFIMHDQCSDKMYLWNWFFLILLNDLW